MTHYNQFPLAIDPDKQIASLISSQFTEFDEQYAPILVEFVKQYFAWLESDGMPLWYAKRHLLNLDIDATADEFLLHFKKKYIPSVQLSTALTTKKMVKNALPFYRARGTDQAFSLFFRIVFGTDAEIYHPIEDTFSLSSGDWHRDIYLEVTPLETNKQFVGQEIIGVNSQSTAFVDRIVRRFVNERMIECLYISALTGDFETGELIFSTTTQDLSTAPQIVGSLTDLEIVDGSEAFSVGDIVNVTSPTGLQAQARVSGVSTASGLVSFSLVDGGWGYSSSAVVYVSDTVVRLNQISRPLSFVGTQAFLLDTITQPLATMQYSGANGSFNVGDTLTEYDGSGNVLGTGSVLRILSDSGTTGVLSVAPLTGILNANISFYSSANAVTANLVALGYTDQTGSGRILNLPNTVTVAYDTANGVYSVGDVVYQLDANGDEVANAVVAISSPSGVTGSLTLANCSVVPFTNTVLLNRSNPAVGANTNSIGFDLGLQTNSTFTSIPGNYVSETSLFQSGSVQTFSTGFGAGFNVSPKFSFTETANLNIDYLRNYANVALNATTYPGMRNNANGTNGVLLKDALNYETANVGTIQQLVGINPGTNYSFNPIVLIVDPIVSGQSLHDYDLAISSPSGIFRPGELITQPATGAQGLVRFANASFVQVKRITLEDNWVANNFANAGMLVTGANSAFTANLLSVSQELTTAPTGENAVVSSNVVSVNGSVTSLQVLASGYGFNRSIVSNGVYSDLVTYTSADGLRSGTAFGTLAKQGQSQGYYRDTKGFLSDTQKLQDSNYYQAFSYDLRTSVTPDKYEAALKRLLHMSGKKYFTSVVKSAGLGSTASVSVVRSFD